MTARRNPEPSPDPLWYCVKAQPKHEAIASESLRRLFGLECYAPRIRFRKDTRRGSVWFVEAMFPGYVFARFAYPAHHRAVQYAPGVSGIVNFGGRPAIIADSTVEALKEAGGGEDLVLFDPELKIGDRVHITEGALRGLEALIVQLQPAKDRIRVLLDFLGRSVEAEIAKPHLLSTTLPPHQRNG